MFTIGAVYWLLMIIALVFGGWIGYSDRSYRALGSSFLVWILFFLLGVAVFGFPVKF